MRDCGIDKAMSRAPLHTNVPKLGRGRRGESQPTIRVVHPTDSSRHSFFVGAIIDADLAVFNKRRAEPGAAGAMQLRQIDHNCAAIAV